MDLIYDKEVIVPSKEKSRIIALLTYLGIEWTDNSESTKTPSDLAPSALQLDSHPGGKQHK